MTGEAKEQREGKGGGGEKRRKEEEWGQREGEMLGAENCSPGLGG